MNTPHPTGPPRARPVLLGAASLLAALAIPPSLAAAQATPSVQEGSRVRLTVPSLGLDGDVGTVEDAGERALVVRFDFPWRTARVERADIERMEVSVRRERRVLRKVGIGALAGAGTGAVVGLLSGDDEGGFINFTAEEKALMLGSAMGVLGGVVGLVAGIVVRHDVWKGAAVPPRPGAKVHPIVEADGGALRLGLRHTFR